MPLVMQFPGIGGESKIAKHQAWHELTGFSWGGTRTARTMTSGLNNAASRAFAPQLRNATIRRVSDSATSLFWLQMLSSADIPLLKFEWLRTGAGEPVAYFNVELKNARLVSIHESSDGGYPAETMEVLYQQITLGVTNIGNTLTGSQEMVTYIIPQHAGG